MSTKKSTYLRIALPALMLIMGAFTAGAILKTSKWPGNAKAYSGAAAQQTEPMRNIRFAVYDVGIYPQQMEVDAGRLSIVFDDRTGKYSGFVVERISDNGVERVAQMEARKDHWRTRAQVNVVPGRYRIFASDRPEIQSALVVNP